MISYKGTVRNGVVVLDGDFRLRDGEKVEVRPLVEAAEEGPTLYDRLKGVIGTGTALPTDLAANHDHYVRGAPRGVDAERAASRTRSTTWP